MKIPTLVLGLVGALLLLSPHVFAAQLGVNYYDESLTDANGEPYIMRSIDQVGQDLDNIKTISNNVKFYLNPYVEQNTPWVEQLLQQADARGMHTVVNIMDDHHQLDSGNWDDYANRVVNICQRLNGKTDEFLVGNEITLHSSMSRTEIRDKVINLMDRCDAVFDGQVSYEEFWYANDVWRGATDRPIYFMMYEGLDAFKTNLNELGSNFGSKGYIGEWGEDLLENHVEYDEQWQKDQIQQRWAAIQQSPAPVAYIFTYREPSWTSFSMLRPGTDERRPLWEAFGAPGTAPAPVQPPTETVVDVITEPTAQPDTPVFDVDVPEQPTQEAPAQPEAIPPTPETQQSATPQPETPEDTPADTPEPVVLNPELKSEATDGACTTLTYGTAAGDITLLNCPKPEGDAELYVLSSPQGTFRICVEDGCVTDENGYDRYERAERDASSDADARIKALEASGEGEKTADAVEETGCRRITYGETSALICDHEDHYEMYRQSGDGKICAGSMCVGPEGFART